MCDAGLLCAACMENIQFELLAGDASVNMGSILENAIAQQLSSGGFSLFYHDSTARGEVGFAVQSGTGVSLVEVKSGADYRRHKALDNVMAVEEWAFKASYVLCGGKGVSLAAAKESRLLRQMTLLCGDKSTSHKPL